MIPNQTTTAVVESTIPGRTHKAQIKAEAMGHVMSILAGLYSNKELAIVREYSTNARDSHIEAGQTRPIEVTTPGPFQPYLSIKDYGIGMDEDALESIYRNYGDSTKRDSDAFNGTLGMGSKSAFAYAEQFNVTGIKNGVKTQILVSKAFDGSGEFTVVSTTATDEPNGVEVRIPTERSNSIKEEAEAFFRFWPAGTVLLNGKDPHADLTHIADDLYYSQRRGGNVTVSVYTDSSLTKDYIVMGGVPYPTSSIDEAIDSGSKWYRSFGVVAYVEMGEVAFTPSREALLRCDLSKATVEAVRKVYQKNIIEAAKKDVATAGTGAQAIRKAHTWRSQVPSGVTFEWNGHTVPHQSSHIGSSTYIVWKMDSYRKAVSNRGINYDFVTAENDGVLFVKNFTSFDKKSVTQTQKSKVREYLTANSLNERNIVFLPDGEIPGSPWTSQSASVEWATINAIKLNPKTRTYSGTGKVYSGGYDVLSKSNGYFSVEQVTANDEVYYFTTNQTFVGNAGYYLPVNEYVSQIAKFSGDAKIVKVGAGRVQKFKRLLPKAKDISALIAKIPQMVTDALTEEDLNVLSYSNSGIGYSLKDVLDPAEIDDPQFAAFLRAKKANSSDTRDTYNMATQVFKGVDTAAAKRYTVVKYNFKSNYPLLNDYMDRRAGKDAHLYINAKYAATVAAQNAAKAAQEGK